MFDFKLRSVALDADDQGCRFDVTPSQFGLLGRGTPELVSGFLRELQIEAEPATWRITPFRTYYYTQFPDSTSWGDVFPRAFEVVVRFARPAVGPPPDPFRQYVASGSDPTWDASELPLDWSEGRVLIVTDCFRRTRDELLASLEERPVLARACERVELVPLRPDVLQMRMDVGTARFPDDQPRLYSLMEEASHFCRSFTWVESIAIC